MVINKVGFLLFRNDRLAGLLIIAVTTLWFLIIFYHFTPARVGDWDESLAHQELQRKIILKYHQFPLWNPYICGGEPWIAHAKSSFLSPFFLFILIFGTIPGILMAVFLQVFLGLFGMYCLSRYFKIGYVLSLTNALFFLGLFTILIYFFPYPIFNVALFPWIYMFFKKSQITKRYLFCLSVIFSYLIYSGAYGIFIFASAVIAVDTLFYVNQKKDFKFLISLSGFIFTIIFLSAVKLFPLLTLLQKYPRYVKLPLPPAYIDIAKIPNLLRIDFLPDVLGHVLLSGISFFFILAIITLWKKNRELVCLNIIFMLLFFGDDSPINLWRLLHALIPIMNDSYQALIICVISVLSLSIGLSIEELQRRIPTLHKAFSYVRIALFFLVGYLVLGSSSRVFLNRTPIDYDLSKTQSTFFQTTGKDWKMFESIYYDKGVVNGRDPIGNQIQTSVIPKDNPGYRGEYFLANNFGKINQTVFTPEKIEFNLDMFKPDTLVINQNYFPGWRSSFGKVINHQGLIGVEINKRVPKVSVYYLPNSFITGSIITFSFLLIIIYAKRKRATRVMDFFNLI